MYLQRLMSVLLIHIRRVHKYCVIVCLICMYVQYILTEINECLVNNGDCDHICTNTPGSYYCTCKTGYQLQPDRRKCLGES